MYIFRVSHMYISTRYIHIIFNTSHSTYSHSEIAQTNIFPPKIFPLNIIYSETPSRSTYPNFLFIIFPFIFSIFPFPFMYSYLTYSLLKFSHPTTSYLTLNSELKTNKIKTRLHKICKVPPSAMWLCNLKSQKGGVFHATSKSSVILVVIMLCWFHKGWWSLPARYVEDLILYISI